MKNIFKSKLLILSFIVNLLSFPVFTSKCLATPTKYYKSKEAYGPGTWHTYGYSTTPPIYNVSCIRFRATDEGNIINWSFPGGTPSTATTNLQNEEVVVYYASTGVYTFTKQEGAGIIEPGTFTINQIYCPNHWWDFAIEYDINNPYVLLTAIDEDGTPPLFGPYTYMWSTGATTPNITVNAIGTYSLTVTASDGSTRTNSQIVSAATIPTLPQWGLIILSVVLLSTSFYYLKKG